MDRSRISSNPAPGAPCRASNNLGLSAAMSAKTSVGQGGPPTSGAVQPHLPREPSKEDMELAQQLVNHAQGIQIVPREHASQPSQPQPPQLREPSMSAPSNYTAGTDSQQMRYSQSQIAQNPGPQNEGASGNRRSMGAVQGSGQMCRWVYSRVQVRKRN